MSRVLSHGRSRRGQLDQLRRPWGRLRLQPFHLAPLMFLFQTCSPFPLNPLLSSLFLEAPRKTHRPPALYKVLILKSFPLRSRRLRFSHGSLLALRRRCERSDPSSTPRSCRFPLFLSPSTSLSLSLFLPHSRHQKRKRFSPQQVVDWDMRECRQRRVPTTSILTVRITTTTTAEDGRVGNGAAAIRGRGGPYVARRDHRTRVIRRVDRDRVRTAAMSIRVTKRVRAPAPTRRTSWKRSVFAPLPSSIDRSCSFFFRQWH